MMIYTDRLRSIRCVFGRAAAISVLFFACAAPHRGNSPPPGFAPHSETGLISYYAADFQGHRTASGELFNPRAFTAAHRTLPFGTRLRVTNLENGRSVIVRVNDRGPWKSDRILDVSPAAARKLGLLGRGTVRARIVAVR